mmetsp:Transcript_2880/g.6089  ORF Transcript_2880/g.6089 Transcript_2880/m.6089 type:complete len:512 (-) Transcript_2880:1284-2819(-)
MAMPTPFLKKHPVHKNHPPPKSGVVKALTVASGVFAAFLLLVLVIGQQQSFKLSDIGASVVRFTPEKTTLSDDTFGDEFVGNATEIEIGFKDAEENSGNISMKEYFEKERQATVDSADDMDDRLIDLNNIGLTVNQTLQEQNDDDDDDEEEIPADPNGLGRHPSFALVNTEPDFLRVPERKGNACEPLMFSEGRYTGSSWKWSKKTRENCKPHWFRRAKDVCEELRSKKIFLLGQSTERRLFYMLKDMVLGNEYALRRSGKPDVVQHIRDSTTRVREPTRAELRRVKKCTSGRLKMKFVYGKLSLKFLNALVRARERIADAHRQHKTRVPRSVALIDFSLYDISAGRYRAHVGIPKMFSFFKKHRIVERARKANMVLIWKPPNPVNATHERFLRKTNGTKKFDDINPLIAMHAAKVIRIAQSMGICVLDMVRPFMAGQKADMFRYETRGIHIKDNGRRLYAQLFLNVLRFCTRSENIGVVRPVYYKETIETDKEEELAKRIRAYLQPIPRN